MFLFSFLEIYYRSLSRTEGQTPHRLTLKGEGQFGLRQEFYGGRRRPWRAITRGA